MSPFFERLACGFVLLGTLGAAASLPAASAALPVGNPAPVTDLYTVSDVKVDATAASATAARDTALATGRPIAWTELYQRLTPQSSWDKQPQLNDMQLLRLIRSFEVANERRSTTRYLAEVTYHFNANEVRRLLRDAGPLADARAKPVVVIPLDDSAGFDPDSDWTKVWMTPQATEGVVPLVVPVASVADIATLSRSDLGNFGWIDLEDLADRYNASEIVIASVTPSGTASLRYITSSGVEVETMKVAPDMYDVVVSQVIARLSDAYKARTAVDYGRSTKLTISVDIASPRDWTTIRSRLAQIKTISNVEIIGLSSHEAQIVITHFGRQDQLTSALAQANLDLRANGQLYTLRNLAVTRPAPTNP